MKRVADPADPRRCQSVAPTGQCLNEAEPGSQFCRVHGGRDKSRDEDRRSYLLAQAQDRRRFAELNEPEAVKTLRDEIALLHMLIERRFNLVRNDADLLNACGPLNTLLLTMERLVKSAHQLEFKLDILLSKAAVLRLGDQLCRIIVEELQGIEGYELIVDRIKERVLSAVVAAGNEPPPPQVVETRLIEGPQGDGDEAVEVEAEPA